MNALIVSIHIPHKHSDCWRALQSQFIAETQDEYEYGVIVNGNNPVTYANSILNIPVLIPHRQAIDLALDLFLAHKNRFSHFLLLDSDCWPVRPDWQQVLNTLMGDQYLYAAPVRTENFDVFPHPSAFYMKAEFLDMVDFGFKRANNLLGVGVSDVGAAMPQRIDNRQIWYPLLKTNYIAPHPLYASVYADLFYHHCAGSRGLGFRANSFKFYDHMLDRVHHRKIYGRLTDQLVAQPRKFIDNLRGIGLRVVNKAGEQ